MPLLASVPVANKCVSVNKMKKIGQPKTLTDYCVIIEY